MVSCLQMVDQIRFFRSDGTDRAQLMLAFQDDIRVGMLIMQEVSKD